MVWMCTEATWDLVVYMLMVSMRTVQQELLASSTVHCWHQVTCTNMAPAGYMYYLLTYLYSPCKVQLFHAQKRKYFLKNYKYVSWNVVSAHIWVHNDWTVHIIMVIIHIFHCACAKRPYFYIRSDICVLRPRFPVKCENFGDLQTFEADVG